MIRPFVCLTLCSVLLLACAGEGKEKADKTTSTQADSTITMEEIDLLLMSGDSTAPVFYQRAQLNFNSGNLEGAARDILMAIGRDSTEVEYFHLLSDIQLNAFQSRRALESLQKAVKLDPRNRQSLLKLMELQILLRQYIPAIQTSQQLLSMDPQDYQVFFLRGLLFKEQNEDSLAIVNLQRTVDLNPDMTDAFIMLGDLHEKKSSPLAQGYYENAFRADPDNYNAMHAYAFYLQNHGEEEKALNLYQKMMQIDDVGPAPFVNSAVLYMNQDSFSLAKTYLEEAEKLDSSFALTPFYLGQCLKELGEVDAAKAAFERALAIDPEYAEARKELNAL